MLDAARLPQQREPIEQDEVDLVTMLQRSPTTWRPSEAPERNDLNANGVRNATSEFLPRLPRELNALSLGDFNELVWDGGLSTATGQGHSWASDASSGSGSSEDEHDLADVSLDSPEMARGHSTLKFRATEQHAASPPPVKEHLRHLSQPSNPSSLREVVVVRKDSETSGSHDASLSLGRVDLRLIDYLGAWPRALHLLYPLYIVAPLIANIFLDFNLIYALVQVALDPRRPVVAASLVARSQLAVPSLQPTTAWWVAVAVASACAAGYYFGIFLVRNMVLGYRRLSGTGGRVPIGRIYADAATFDLACASSFHYFSLLWRVRLAPFQRTNPLRVGGTTVRDGIVETFARHVQTWPTTLLMLPRGGLALTLLFVYGQSGVGTTAPLANLLRDSAFFDTFGYLTPYASFTLLVYGSWTAASLAIVILSALGLLLFGRTAQLPTLGPQQNLELPVLPYTNTPAPQASPSAASDATKVNALIRPSRLWKIRQSRRIRAAILYCTESTGQGSSFNVSRDQIAEIAPWTAELDGTKEHSDRSSKSSSRAWEAGLPEDTKHIAFAGGNGKTHAARSTSVDLALDHVAHRRFTSERFI